MRSKRSKAKFKLFCLDLLYGRGPMLSAAIAQHWNQEHKPLVTSREASALLRAEPIYFEQVEKKWDVRCKRCVFYLDIELPLCADKMIWMRPWILRNYTIDLRLQYLKLVYNLMVKLLPCKHYKPKHENK